MKKGKLIVIEGIDGAGKSTLAEQMKNELNSCGFGTVVTHEPWSKRWEKSVKSGDLMASTADRAAHMHGYVWPCLAKGLSVIMDRFYLSCAAYLKCSHREAMQVFNQQRELFDHPDLWILLDTPVGTCVDRVCAREAEDETLSIGRANTVRNRMLDIMSDTARDPSDCIIIRAKEPQGAAIGAAMRLIRGTE